MAYRPPQLVLDEHSSLTVSTTSVLALNKNHNRIWAMLMSDLDNLGVISLRFKKPALSSSFIELEAGDYYVIDALHPWFDEVYVVATTASNALWIMEINRRL